MKPNVSIILPIFKVENYLRRCVDSIISQTLENIEIILATDGPETCDKICYEYEKKDSRVKVLFHPGSYGKAFNRGLDIAQGEYIGIVETDDWCEKTMFEKLYTKAKIHNADVVKCGFYFAFDDESKNYSVLYDGYETNFSVERQPDFLSSQPSVWSCIYKKEFLVKNKISMIEERMSFIDGPFHYETLCKAKTYILLKEPLYYYYQNNPGQTVQNIKLYDGLKAEEFSYQKFHENKQIYDKIQEGFIYSTILHLNWNWVRMKTKEQKKQFWKAAHCYAESLDVRNCKFSYFSPELKQLFDFLKRFKSCPNRFLKKDSFMNKLFSCKRENGVRTLRFFGLKIHLKNYPARAVNKFRKLSNDVEIIRKNILLLNAKEQSIQENILFFQKTILSELDTIQTQIEILKKNDSTTPPAKQ